MYNISKILPQNTFLILLNQLPDLKYKGVGRPRCQKDALLNGILQVLINGVPWKKIADCDASPSSCHRYFQELQRRGMLKKIFKLLVNEKTDIIECASDTDSTTSFRFKYGTGWDGKHKKVSTKISLISDINGLPVDVEVGCGNIHDKDFLYKHLENIAGRRICELNLDKIYTSAQLRREMKQKGCHVNMKIRGGDYIRKRGPKFAFREEKYRVRFLIEKCFAWMENFRRLRNRWEYKIANFKGMVYLALIIILIRS